MIPNEAAAVFLQEASDLLEQLEQALLDLEHTPGNTALIDTAFRALHTIKGSGAMFGFDRVAAFTHHVETAFERVRKGQAPASPALIALTLAAKDEIRRLLDGSDGSDGAGDAILEQLRALLTPAGEAGAEAPAHAPPPVTTEAAMPEPGAGATTWRVLMRLPPNAMKMGTNPLNLLDELRDFGPCVVTALTDRLPPLADIDLAECHLGWDVRLTTTQSRDVIEQVFLFVLDDMELEIEQVAADAAPAPAPRQAAAPPAPVAAAEAPVERPAERQAAPQAAAPQAAPPRAAAPRADDSIRVPAARLDDLMDRVGELVIAQSRLRQVAAASNDIQVKSIAEEIERLALDLRDTTMGVRMVPVAQLFGRFRRLMHDLARELGKDIALVLEGEDTELDKTVIERLSDPLVHMIRNACDHGLEPPAERLAAGKSAQGTLTLSARHAGNEVQISIADDGRGLDRARITEKAHAQGLLVPGATSSDAELFQVLFQAGFSTARTVTNLSGRGVGLDVVKRAIEALRGTIDIASTQGQGTTMTLRLPLTLAIIDGLLVRVGNGRYVIPLTAVEECVALTAEQDTRARGGSFLNIRGDLIPFLRLRALFETGTPPDPFQKVVIVSAKEQRVGLVVDQVIGEHQTVIKSLSRLHADVTTFSGATILGDGTVALILDVAHLLAYGQAFEDRARVAVG